MNVFSQTSQSGFKTIHSCPTSFDVKSCSSNCVRFDSSTSIFLVDKSINSVLVKNYQDKKLQSSSFFKNCRIFNGNNWECIDGYQSDSMVDGIYIHTSSNPTNQDSYNPMVGSPYFCSK